MKHFSKVPLVCLGLGCLALWSLSWLLETWFLPNYETRAQFGDMFGAINSFFSGIALVGVIYTVYLQQKEIQSQREEEHKNEEARLVQMQNFAEQLRLLQEQNQMEKERARRESTPVFQWRGSSGDDRFWNCTFVNLGGLVQIEKVTASHNEIDSSQFENNWVPSGAKGFVSFRLEPNLPKEIDFEIVYVNALGIKDSQRFKCIGQSNPIKVEG